MNDKYSTTLADIPLLEYTNFFVANEVWTDLGVDKDIATYDLVIRELPEKWSFYVFEGLDRLVDYIANFRFDEEAIRILKSMGVISSEDYYGNFRFTGDVWALKNGTIFFPGEPIVRVTGPMKEVNLITAFLMNAVGYPVRITSKAVRVKLSAEDSNVSMAAVSRLPSFESSYPQLKAILLMGCSPGAVPLAYKKFDELVPEPKNVFFNVNHAVVKSFENEKQAFSYIITKQVGKFQGVWVMIDTYDYRSGILNLIEEIKKVPDFDQKGLYIGLDSGDLAEMARYVRNILDDHGLQDIRIQAMSNLDEYRINRMVRDKVPIDLYAVATEFVNVTDCPKLEVVYKLAELLHPDGSVEMKAKLTKGKESYPGRKQVYRVYEDGMMAGDCIGFEDENLGDPLLEKVIDQGSVVHRYAAIGEIKAFIEDQLQKLPYKYKDITKSEPYAVTMSDKMKLETEMVKKKHLH